jgi:hypothetical protein
MTKDLARTMKRDRHQALACLVATSDRQIDYLAERFPDDPHVELLARGLQLVAEVSQKLSEVKARLPLQDARPTLCRLCGEEANKRQMCTHHFQDAWEYGLPELTSWVEWNRMGRPPDQVPPPAPGKTARNGPWRTPRKKSGTDAALAA